jgi:hypothetical protein
MTVFTDLEPSIPATDVATKESSMVGMQAYLVSIYQADLRREAARNRLRFDDTLSGEVRFDGGRQPHHPDFGLDPRKALARIASGVSRAAAGTARRLDPTFDDGASRRHASGAAGR